MYTKYDKFIIAIIGAVLGVLSVQYASNHTVQIAVAVATALGVYITPNKSGV